MSDQKILIVAGESSGDMHGAALVQALRNESASLNIFALGGTKLKEVGAVLLEDMLKVSVVGLIEAVRHYRIFRKIMKKTLAWIDSEKPDVVVLIDFPGFNLKLAKYVKKRGIKIVYFVSPQIWAWGKWRIWKIKSLVDKMLVLFKFEEEMYRKVGIDAVHVGHPILDSIPSAEEQQKTREMYSHLNGKKIIGLLPGSRINELKAHLPILLKTASLMYSHNKDLHFILGLADGISEDMARSILSRFEVPVEVLPRGAYTTMTLADLAIVAAGTATLETACFLVPMIILYRISWLTWCLGRIVVDVPFLGMVNIVAGEEIAPEYLQSQAKPSKIEQKAIEILEDENKITRIKEKLRIVRDKLGQKGASRKAARSILEIIAKN